MTDTKIVSRRRVEGQVLYNTGDFCEIQTNGIEGIEEGLLLDAIQAHREDTNDTREEFRLRFPVGMWLDITTTIEIEPALEQDLNLGSERLQ